jgi:murein DD-endopeptidase MepM/ murein hydrolase activator NlpD
MKKILLLLLIILPFYLLVSLYFLDKTYFLCPIEYKRDILIRNDSRGDGFFGAERRGKRLHQGLDLLAEIGEPVLAARSGIVVAAEASRGMGNYVIIRHPGNIATLYGHLSEICVGRNILVRQGQVIGTAGKTGNANHPAILPHLHFEVREKGKPIDPLKYLQ